MFLVHTFTNGIVSTLTFRLFSVSHQMCITQLQNRTITHGFKINDLKLAFLEKEKKESLIRAWEERKISKGENNAEKKISDVQVWENRKKADVRNKMAKFGGKMKNKKTAIHREAEEKRAVIKATKEKDILEAEEMAAKFRASGLVHKPTRKCFF